MKKIIKYTFYLLALLMILTSCEVDRTEPIFSDPPAVRIAGIINELQTALLAQPQGFTGMYFPNNSVVGGVNVHMNFNSDLRVKMTSDFKSTTSLTDTRYDIVTGTTAAELVFTSGSRHITDLVQDGSSGFKTFFGNNSFQYIGTENGVISFQEVRSGGTLKLVPSGFTNFDTESVANTTATFASKQAFTASDCLTTSVFKTLLIDVTNTTGTTNYVVTYNAANQFANAETIDSDGFAVGTEFGVAFTQSNGVSGLTVSPAFESGGVKFENFTKNTAASDIEYTATVDGVTARMYYDNLPSLENDDLNLLSVLNRRPQFSNEERFGFNPLTSCGFNAMTAVVDASLRSQGFRYTGCSLFMNYTSTSTTDLDSRILLRVARLSDGAGFSGTYYVKVENRDGLVFVTPSGAPVTGNAAFFANSSIPLLNFFYSSNGLFFEDTGSFESNLFRYTNASGTLTSMDNPAQRVHGLFYR